MARREIQPSYPAELMPSENESADPGPTETALIDMPLPPTSLPSEAATATPQPVPPAEAPRAIAAVDAETGLIYVKFNGHMTRGQALMFANELRSKANRL